MARLYAASVSVCKSDKLKKIFEVCMTRVFFVVPLVFKRRSVGIRTFPPGHIPPRTFPLPDNSPPFLRGVGHFPLPPCTTITVHCTAGELQTVTSRRRSILHSLGSTKDTSIFGSTGLSVYWNCSLNCMHAAVSVIHSFIHPFNYFTIHIKTKLYSMWNLLEKMSIDCKVRPGTRRLWPGHTVKNDNCRNHYYMHTKNWYSWLMFSLVADSVCVNFEIMTECVCISSDYFGGWKLRELVAPRVCSRL